MTKIVVLDGATLNPGDNPWTGLESLGMFEVFDGTDPALLQQRARDAEILVINKFRLHGPELDQLPNLKMVAVTATGVDCIDAAYAKDCGIIVANVPVYGTESVAQHVFSLLLHILHRVDLHDSAIRDGEWERSGNFSFWRIPLVELAGKTLGIVGYGRIGRAVASLGRAFGMNVLVHTRSPQSVPKSDDVTCVDLDELLRRADVVSLNCPLTEETRGMINADRLEMMKASAILLNASRGPLIVEQDLADALNRGTLYAAGLDVASTEPIQPDNPLLAARQCFLTPHLAWATLEARRRLMSVTVDNVVAFLNGRPQNVVNP